MKIRNLLILGLVLMGFTYCSSDEVLDGPAKGETELGAGTKMQLVVNMPSAVNTRSTSGSTLGEEKGSSAESGASKVLIAIFNEDASKFLMAYEQPLVKTIDFANKASYQTQVFEAPILVSGNSYSVYLFVNPYSKLTAESDLIKSLDKAFTTTETTLAEAIKEFASENNFFMSTAEPVIAGEVNESAKNLATPYKVTANVERAAARFDYKDGGTDNTFLIQASRTADTTNGIVALPKVNVQFTYYKLINTSRSFFNLKRVLDNASTPKTTIGGAETASYFVVDTDWESKLTSTGADLTANFFDPLTVAGNYKTSGFTSLPTAGTNDYKFMSYVTENTTPETKVGDVVISKKGLATGVVFKGHLVFEGSKETSLETVYVWNNTFYGAYDNLPLGVKAATVNKLKDQFIAAGVTAYTKINGEFPVYYVYYNRHNDNGGPTTGPMEFAVVRNNVYKLSISKVNMFGHPEGDIDPNPEDPTKPIEDGAKMYMEVTATVLPWTVRTNEIEF